MIKIIISMIIMLSLVQALYNLTQAKLMANLSQLTYANQDNLTSWNCIGCIDDFIQDRQIVYIKAKNLVSITGYVPKFDCFVAAFRGTNLNKSYSNLLTVIKTFHKKIIFCTNCSTHKGFYQAFDSINQSIFANLNNLKMKYGEKKIIFGGHSLGGVLASLTALQYKTTFQGLTVQVYNFGKPRIGNMEFANYFNSKIPKAYRIVYKRDLVPHLPARFAKFRHEGIQIYYSNQQMTEVTVCTGDIPRQCSSNLMYSSISDHRMRQYMKLLNLPDQTTNITDNSAVSNLTIHT